MRDRPSEAASRPGASGARSSRAVSAPRTIRARRSERLGREPELLDHRVEGAGLAAMAPEHALDVEGRRRRSARPPPATSAGATNRKTAAGSTKRRISQGQAMRSIFGPRARHPDGAAPRVARRQLGGGHQRQAGLRPGLEAALERLGRHALVPQPGGDALAELLPLLADDDGGAAREARRPMPAPSRGRGATEPGIRRGSAAKSSVGADVDDRRALRRADEAGELLDGDRG